MTLKTEYKRFNSKLNEAYTAFESGADLKFVNGAISDVLNNTAIADFIKDHYMQNRINKTFTICFELLFDSGSILLINGDEKRAHNLTEYCFQSCNSLNNELRDHIMKLENEILTHN